MSRVPSFVWAVLVYVLIYLLLEYGIAPLTGMLTETAAPLPASLVLMYCGMAAVGILLYLSVREDRWERFKGPLVEFLRGGATPSRTAKTLRLAFLIMLPLVIGWRAYAGASALPEPPGDPPGIHFTLPDKYLPVENPLKWTEANIREGGILYMKNCAMCHGDALDGDGLFARAWQPAPANFRDSGTIAQLDENYLFWRIKTGGPGVPRGTINHRSAMPVWDKILTDIEIWKIIMFEYTSAGQKPAKRG